MQTTSLKLLRRVLAIAMLLSAILTSGRAQQVYIKRTYYDLSQRQLHEEFQYIRTASVREARHGYYKEYDEDGVLWKRGTYRNNQAEGRQLEYLNVGGQPQLQYDITVRHGIAHGPYIRYKGPNDRLSAGGFVEGSREGTWKFYYADGHEVCTYRNDKKEGPATFYWKSGKVAKQYAYRNDEQYNEGEIRRFYEDGSPEKSEHYTDGQMDGRFRAWYPNGRLRYEENYVAGSQEGRSTFWYENGQIKAEGIFRDNRPDSLMTDYYEDGTKAQERWWANGQLNGLVRTFSVQGDVLTETEYHDGQLLPSAAEIARRQHQDSVQQAAARQQQARQAEAATQNTIRLLLQIAASKRQNLTRATAPQRKLYNDLYARLLADYEASTAAADQLAKARRLSALMALAEALYLGEQPELNKAIRKENDLAKVLALTGL